MVKKKTKKTYDSISPTAIDVAFARTFSDIPYSKEIFDLVKKRKGYSISSGDRASVKNCLIPKRRLPYFEARYKTINKLLAKTGIRNILEIASGVSPRGLVMTKNKSVNFVELDLPDILNYKKKLAGKILKNKKLGKRYNLHFFGANALDKKQLFKAATFFPAGPIAVICEGLLRYLNQKEKKALTKNIHALLSKYGGVWITPDITSRQATKENKILAERNKLISKLTKTNIEKNLFSSEKELLDFFRKSGLNVKTHKLVKIKDLVSPKKLRLSIREVEEEIGRNKIAVQLSVKN